MSKDKLTDYSATNSLNTDVGGVNIDEGMLPSDVNNALREVMTHLKDFAEGTQAVNNIKFAGATTTGDINFGDNDKAVFGAGSDLQIYHSGVNSFISDAGAGDLFIQAQDLTLRGADASTRYLTGVQSTGAVTAFYGNAAKLATTATGADITGVLTADGAQIDGDATLTNAIPTITLESNNDSYTNLLIKSNSIQKGMLSYHAGNNYLMLAHNEAGVTTNTPSISIQNGDISFYDSTGVTQGFFWDASTQRLGLGSTAPVRTLDIATTTGGTTIHLTDDSTGHLATDGVDIQQEGTLFQILNREDGDIRLGTSGTERLRIDSAGKVGIGNGTPSSFYSLADNLVVGTGSGGNGMTIYSGSADSGYIGFNDTVSASMQGFIQYNHSGDYMAFGPNGSEKARLDASGNFMVGKAAVNVATAGVEARADGLLAASRSASTPMYVNRLSDDGTLLDLRKDNTTVGTIGTENDDLTIGTGDTGLQFRDASDAIRPFNISTNTARDANIDLGRATERFRNAFFSGEVQAQFFTGNGDTDTYMDISSNPANTIKFYTGGSERARVNASGAFLVGKTVDSISNTGISAAGGATGGGHLTATNSGNPPFALNRLASDGSIADFYRQGSVVGSISVTTSATTYNTTSDIRLKQDIEPIADGTDKLMAMNPVSYNWKADPDGPRSMGFIAQEMQEVMPEAVAVGDDEDAMMSMDYGRITPILVSALQDAHRKIEELAAEIAELKAK